MSKYDVKSIDSNEIDINTLLVTGENIIWSGVPKKIAFIINKVLIMLPIAILWLAFDSVFIVSAFSQGEMLWFMIPFFAIHLMPVWIWLSNILTANKKWKNTKYIVTDKRIIVITGFVGMDYQTLYYKDIKNVRMKINFIDKLLDVGDIYFDVKESNQVAFLDVESCYELYPKLQKIVLDIQTDIEYPNNLRPEFNDGYNTKYNSKFNK